LLRTILLRSGIALSLSILLLFAPNPLSAAETALSTQALEQQISDFAAGPLYRFAPETTARARAMLAAAGMAERRRDMEARDQGLREAAEMLANARRSAEDFSTKYATSLKLERAASQAAGNIPDSALSLAQSSMQDLIRAFEHGDFNESAALAADTNRQLLAVLRAKLPGIAQKTDAALLAASRAGAKRYAPVMYGQAKQWLADALAYNDGLSKEWPAQPRLGIRLATRAAELATQIKQWRKKPDSYEMLVLKARDERLRMARALGITAADSDPSVDVDVQQLVSAIEKQRQDMQQQEQRHAQVLATLQEQHASDLEAKGLKLRNELARTQGKQMSELKEAFRAKLERETFETRRQQKLGKLFKKNELEILANVDGSLLMRLSALHFASGRTSIDKKYFDLLNRVRAGLDLYPDRKLTIEGHTDNRGDPKLNQALSLKRAETVRDFLIAAGMDGSRLKALGYGEVRPVASNDYDRGRAMNRRIDIIIQAAP